MRKGVKLGLLLLGGAISTSLALYANEDKPSSSTFVKPIIFSPIDGKEWVEKCVEQHPEILWLADANVRKTEEGQATLQGTYSEQLFGQKYIEFDRTIMTIQCLKLILDGSDQAYLTFTAAQKDGKLSRESFLALHLQGQQLLKSKWKGLSELQMAQAMETALVLGDIGKSEKARELLKPYGIKAPDHDDFYGEAMQVIVQHPKLCPSFDRLPSPAKELLAEIANLAHYGHVTHLEGGAGMFSKLKESRVPSSDPIALSFDLFVHTCDVAGALGHVNNQSSLVYTEPAHRAMQAMGDAVRVLSNTQKTEWDAYNDYLAVRASWLGLSPEDRSDRVLSRIGAMLRLFTIEEGVVLKKAMLEIDVDVRNRIAAQLDVQQQDQPVRTPTYMPAVLVNLSNHSQLGETKEERLFKAITLGLPFITRVLEKHKELVANHEIDPNIPLNFNKMAGVAKTSPHSLSDSFFIDEEGNVLLMGDGKAQQGVVMNHTIEQQKKKFFIGLELRTSNEECSATMPPHKERFFKENIPSKIPHKINGDILALYTDYEGDYTKPYSWILGCEVSSLDEVPEGLVGKVIPDSNYAVFTTQGGFPQGLIAAWQAVWKSHLHRCYTSDFEVYRSDFDPQKNPQVKVFIAIKN
jgi:predicted transcriptional regulator YdeE